MTIDDTAWQEQYRKAKKRASGLSGGLNPHFFGEGLAEIWRAVDGFARIHFPDTYNRAMHLKIAAKHQDAFITAKKPDALKESLERLQQAGLIRDMRPKNGTKLAVLLDTTSLEEIFFVCYRIRSNFEHGTKALEGDSPEAQRNRDLVRNAFFATFYAFQWILMEEKINIV